MDLLIKKATVIDKSSSFHLKQVDILIKDGMINNISEHIDSADIQTVDSDDLHISIGWSDVGTQICDPGFEHKEDIESVTNAAAKGGYTQIIAAPNTYPVVDSKAQISYLNAHTKGSIVDFKALGAITKGTKAKN